MAKISLRGTGSVQDVANYLTQEIEGHAMSCELVDAVDRKCGAYEMRAMVFEKYFMRASNRASLTVVVSGDDETIFVDAIGAGGGQGPVFRMSWGAEEDFVAIVSDALRDRGFR